LKQTANSEKAVTQLRGEASQLWHSRGMQHVKRRILGQYVSDGWLARIAIYFLLAIIAYLYLQPLLYMVTTSVKSVSDLIDPAIQWIPRELYWDNLVNAWGGLHYVKAFGITFGIALSCSVLQVVSCAITGYALARLNFPGKSVALALVIVTFLVPPQITMIPLFAIFGKLGWINTYFVFIVPALLGQGLRGALFVIIFRQFFLTQPKALEEAAKMDGATAYRLFFRIMLPLAKPAIIVVFLFSFIWYWNMYYEPSMFLTKDQFPLSLRLNFLSEELIGNRAVNYATQFGKDPISEGPRMAGALLIILPPLLVYSFTQRWFTEGIERTGLVE